MKRLLFCIVLLPGLLVGIKPVSANQKTLPPSEVRNEAAAEQNVALGTQSRVWVIEDKQPKRQPFIWVVKDIKKAQQQPLLRLVKDATKPDVTESSESKEPKQSELQPFYTVVKNSQKIEGLFTLYRDRQKGKIYLEVKPTQLNKNFLGTVTMESGIGERGIYSGLPLQDFLFYFRRVNNNLHFVVRNVNFRTSPGDPQARSVRRSFSDSVLYSLPIKSIHPQRKTLLIDLGDLLLSDVPGLSSELSSLLQSPYQLDDKKSYFGDAKAFPLNIELESVYGFSASSTEAQPTDLETLPDSRALTLKVHYSLSELPENSNYQPRLADDRIGYFITAYQDFTNDNHQDPFVRYINRWHLEKQDPTAPLSPPKKPIVFWIENTVPLEYRGAIKEGVLMWNKAFLKAGFKNAIEVRQMPDNAKWDPADVRYNTIRWLNTVDGFFALGPSRVNPLTGEILNASVIVDGSFVRSLKQQYRNLVEGNQAQMKTSSLSQLISEGNLCGNGLSFVHPGSGSRKLSGVGNQSPSRGFPGGLSKMATEYDICYGIGITNQFAMGSMAMALFHQTTPDSKEAKDYIHEYLRLIIAHEVGHNLGLRHNFRGSTLLKPEEMNDTSITRTQGLTTSVMDYIPPNIAPQGVKQGDYFPAMVGPYDDWAIEYGYTPIPAAAPQAEQQFLNQIAQRSADPKLAYATDEDMIDVDPDVNAWDHSGDVLRYAQWQLDNDRAMWNRLNQHYPAKGESYSDLSEMFDTVFYNYLQNTYFITKYIGGQSFRRDHAGEPNGRLPFEPVPVEKQRQALVALQKYIFDSHAFTFPPELLNKLAPSRWLHWGKVIPVVRLDYPIHDSIFMMQSGVLQELLSGDRLTRLRDIELKSQPGQALTLPELFDTLQNGIWTEVVQPDGKQLQISSLRRALQSQYLDILTSMVLHTQPVPEDARTLAWYKLRQLRDKLNQRIAHSHKMDEYTKAHLEVARDRINKALNAQLQSG